MKLTFYNEVIQFDYELGTLMKASEDPMFTSYLSDIKNDIQNNPGRVPVYRQQVIDNYSVYADKMNKLGCPVERFFFKAIYGDMEAPEIKNSVFGKASEEPAQSPQSASAETGSVPSDAGYADGSADGYTEESAEQYADGTADDYAEENIADTSEDMAAENFAEDLNVSAAYVQPAAFDPYTGRPLNQPVHNNDVSSVVTSKKTEFAVGAIVMSIIGSVFLLTGLVYFSINFLDTFAQGMVMYLVCAIVLCVSEFVIRRLVPKLSAVFTAIGISGVFLTTIVNYKSLENFNLPVTAIILGVCAVLVCFFGYIRKSQLYSIIGFLAAFISSIAIGSHVTPTEFIVITVCTLIISSLWLLFPVEKYISAVTPVMLGAEVTYMIACSLFTIDSDSNFTKNFIKLIFYVCSMTVINFVFYINTRRCRKSGDNNEVVTVFNIIIYCIAVFYCSFACLINISAFRDLTDAEEIILGLVIYFILVIPQAVFTYLLREKQDSGFTILYISSLSMGLILLFGVHNVILQAVLLMAVCLVSRFMTKYETVNKSLKITDVVIQAFIMFFAICFALSADYMAADYIGLLILIAGFAASIFIGFGFLNIIQIFSVLAITLILGVVTREMPDGLGQALGLGVVLLFTFLINYIKRIKGRNFVVFNWFALIWSLILLISGSRIDFSAEGILIFSIGAVFGLALVILLMNKEYGMPFCRKYIMIPAYLTFISFLVPLESGFVLSIILMAIAVISVIIGFVLKEKSIRVYGLILSIVICAKIALIDFVAIGDVKSKTIMYILVGALALAIGCIYMVLEARESKAARVAAAQNQYVQTGYAQAQPQYVQPQQAQYVQSGQVQPEYNTSVEGNTENKELYEENKTV